MPAALASAVVDHGGWYDRKIFRMKQIVDVTLIGAMGPPGGGRQVMTSRMIRHMHMITFVDLSTDEIKTIFPPSLKRRISDVEMAEGSSGAAAAS